MTYEFSLDALLSAYRSQGQQAPAPRFDLEIFGIISRIAFPLSEPDPRIDALIQCLDAACASKV